MLSLNNLTIQFFCGLALLLSSNVQGSDVAIGVNSSSSSQAQRVKASLDLGTSHRLGFAASQSRSTSDELNDALSSSQRLSYRYKAESSLQLEPSYRQSDDGSYFESKGAGLKARIDWSEETRVFGMLEWSQRVYSKNRSESLQQRGITFGVDSEFTEDLYYGWSAQVLTYSSAAENMNKALSGLTVTNSDLSDFAELMNERVLNFYLEKSYEAFDVGASFTSFAPRVGSVKSSSFDIYGEWTLASQVSVGFALQRSKSDLSSEFTDSTDLSISYSFD